MANTVGKHDTIVKGDADIGQTRNGPDEASRLWLVTGYNAYKRVARDPRLSADHFQRGFPAVFPVKRRSDPEGHKTWRTYSGMDAPEHAEHRRLVAPEFTSNRIAQLRPEIERVVSHYLNQLFHESDNADLVRDFAIPVVADVIRNLLGVPKNRIDAWTRYSDILLGNGVDHVAVAAASVSFRAELAKFIADKETAGEADLTSRLIATYKRKARYAPEQILEFVGAIFLAGLKSTASMIALGALTLMDAPEAARAVASGEPHAKIPILEELLRVHSVADLVTVRVATEQLEIEGCTIRAGDGVVASTAAANRDLEVFSSPDEFQASGGRPHHLAFGHGPHRCLGEHLARLQIEIALSALFNRFPRLIVADSYDRPGVDESEVFRSLTAPLMVTRQRSRS